MSTKRIYKEIYGCDDLLRKLGFIPKPINKIMSENTVAVLRNPKHYHTLHICVISGKDIFDAEPFTGKKCIHVIEQESGKNVEGYSFELIQAITNILKSEFKK